MKLSVLIFVLTFNQIYVQQAISKQGGGEAIIFKRIVSRNVVKFRI